MTSILGINFNNARLPEILKTIEDFLNSSRPHYIVTVNAEILLNSLQDQAYAKMINQADLRLLDGSGPQIAGFLKGLRTIRLAGSDLLPKLLNLANDRRLKVLIINLAGGLSSQADIYKFLDQNYPSLIAEIIDLPISQTSLENSPSADIMLVNLGAPWQEKFIASNLNKVNGLKLAIGLGGSFDFLTGRIKRAPQILRSLGLEWLWRLIQQPKRIKRIFKAVIVFPIKFIFKDLLKIERLKN